MTTNVLAVKLELPCNGKWLIETRDGELMITNVDDIPMTDYLDVEKFNQWIEEGKIFCARIREKE